MYLSYLPFYVLQRAADILQTMLRLTEVKSDDICFTTNPMSFTEVMYLYMEYVLLLF
jgi:hypothetical protein